MIKPTVTLKFVSKILLSTFLLELIAPCISYALTNSETQAEFSTYQSGRSNDMVDLLTGDFSYNIPLLSVPGPESDFPVPLFYNAGISLDQEASWVGLGWNINVGSLNRNISVVPDDFQGENLNTVIQNGWGTAYLGLYGRKITNLPKGRASSGDFLETTIAGVMAESVLGGVWTAVNLLTTALNIISPPKPRQLEVEYYPFGCPTYGAPLYAEYNNYLYGSLYLDQTPTVSPPLSSDHNVIIPLATYGMFDDGCTTSNDYHSTFFCEACQSNIHYNSSTSIPNIYKFDTKTDTYYNGIPGHPNDLSNPASVAFDEYNVLGEDVIGSIKPYRFEVGSLSAITPGIYNSRFYNVAPYQSYKPCFKYENEMANSYLYHLPIDASTGGLSHTAIANRENSINLFINDARINGPDPRIKPQAPNTGYNNNKLQGNKYINWFTNEDIKNGLAVGQLLDPLPTSVDSHFRDGLPEKGIGGFCITTSSGVTYHYSLPVYGTIPQSQVSQVANDDGVAEGAYGSSFALFWERDNVKLKKYAKNWLLVAITGPDYIDRNNNNIADQGDWGDWKSFDYGKFTDYYMWREPFEGVMFPATAWYDTNSRHRQGFNETYYLDKINTETNTCLFIKSLRRDGKSAKYPNSQTGFFTSTPLLKLNRIILLNNEDYQKLISSTYSIAKDKGTANNTIIDDRSNNKRTADFNKVFDESDFNSGSVQSFLNNKELREIDFTYNYNLCSNTKNSYEYDYSGSTPAEPATPNLSGKLTLEKVSIIGSGHIQSIPDYTFDYGSYTDANNNPSYDINKWDGWGMYKSDATNAVLGHFKPNSDGTQWNLKKITTPLGGQVIVNYERDRYTSVSGNIIDYSYTGGFTYDETGNYITIPSGTYFPDYPSGTTITIQCRVWEYTQGGGCTDNCCISDQTYSFSATIQSVTTTRINLSTNFGANFQAGIHNCNGHELRYIVSVDGPPYMPLGGNSRVSSLIIKNGSSGEEYAKSYVYTQNGNLNGVGSGVCSIEPALSKLSGRTFPFYNYFDYPALPIMYSKISVYEGTPTDFLSRKEYTYQTPDEDLLIKSSPDYVVSYDKPNGIYTTNYFRADHVNINNSILNDYTSKIGGPISIKKYNKYNELTEMTKFNYVSEWAGSDMGKYSEGTILAQLTSFRTLDHCECTTNPNPCSGDATTNLKRTTIVHYSNILESIEYMNETSKTKVSIKDYNFLTGEVLKIEKENSQGQKYIESSTPAYSYYPSLGSKVDEVTNKNMISSIAGNYRYYNDGSTNPPLLSASFQTWKSDWSYRKHNGIQFGYSTEQPVWRPDKSYVWNSNISSEGFIDNSIFNDYWSNPLDPHWLITSEVVHYDKYSRPIEIKDAAGTLASIKYSKLNKLSESLNANYTGSVYSGAEELNPEVSGFFEGEVAGSYLQFVNVNRSHTGKACIKLDHSHNYGFNYQGSAVGNSPDFDKSKKYTMSVWVHKDNVQNASIYCNLFSATVIPPFINNHGPSIYWQDANLTNSAPKKFGDWYLFTLDIDLSLYPNVAWVEFGTYGNPTSGNVYMDDFRVHPISSPMKSFIYDQKTGDLIAELDNNNIAKKYIYDSSGRLIATYIETTNGFKKISQNYYHYGH